MSEIIHGDSIEVLNTLADESVDLVCTLRTKSANGNILLWKRDSVQYVERVSRDILNSLKVKTSSVLENTKRKACLSDLLHQCDLVLDTVLRISCVAASIINTASLTAKKVIEEWLWESGSSAKSSLTRVAITVEM